MPNMYSYVGDSNIEFDTLGLSKECPIHHIASNKSKKWSDRFRELFKKYNFGKFKNGKYRKDVLNDPRNKVGILGHKGPHGDAHNGEIFDILEKAGENGGAEGFEKALSELKDEAVKVGSDLNKFLTKL